MDTTKVFDNLDRKIERLVTLATVPRPRLAPPRPGTMAVLERVVQCRRPPPPRHLTTPFDYGNRLRRPKGQPSRVTS